MPFGFLRRFSGVIEQLLISCFLRNSTREGPVTNYLKKVPKNAFLALPQPFWVFQRGFVWQLLISFLLRNPTAEGPATHYLKKAPKNTFWPSPGPSESSKKASYGSVSLIFFLGIIQRRVWQQIMFKMSPKMHFCLMAASNFYSF